MMRLSTKNNPKQKKIPRKCRQRVSGSFLSNWTKEGREGKRSKGFYNFVGKGKALQQEMRDGMSLGLAHRGLISLNSFPQRDQEKGQ